MSPAFVAPIGTLLPSGRVPSRSAFRPSSRLTASRPQIALRWRADALRSLHMSETMSDRIQEAIDNAKNASEKYGKSSAEAKVAWDVVEELEAERSHQADNKSVKQDPLDEYCKDAPDADECRVYED